MLKKPEYMPFMFASDDLRQWHVVVVAKWHYAHHDADISLTPSIDVIKEEHRFNSEEEALIWIANWWKNNLSS